eukprot:Gb_11163 [translate_table: standard]
MASLISSKGLLIASSTDKAISDLKLSPIWVLDNDAIVGAYTRGQESGVDTTVISNTILNTVHKYNSLVLLQDHCHRCNYHVLRTGLMHRGAVKITNPETYEELKLDCKGERFAWFPKTLWIVYPKGVNCYDGQNVLTVYIMAFDLRGLDYNIPFMLTRCTMAIDTREINVISSIPEQCQDGIMLENAEIIDDRGNIDADIHCHWNFYNKTMIQATVLSYDRLHSHDSLGITSMGIALALLEGRISTTVARVRVGLLGDKFMVNPIVKQMEESKFDLLLACTSDAILLIEGYNDFLTEELLLHIVDIGHGAVRAICKEVEIFVNNS